MIDKPAQMSDQQGATTDEDPGKHPQEKWCEGSEGDQLPSLRVSTVHV